MFTGKLTMSIRTLQLLPQSPKTQLPTHLKFSKVLYLLKFFTQHVIEALESFYVLQHYHEFDPHVGETSCQIRAYQMIVLSMTVNEVSKVSIYRKISLLKETLGRIEQDTAHYEKVDTTPQRTNDHHTTLDQFIESNNYSFELDEVEFFLVQARILTQYKTYYGDGNPCIDYYSLTHDLGVSKHTARQLVHLYQINLSESSCNFIMQLVNDMPSPPFSPSDLSLLRNFDDDDRYVLPCYWVMKAIYAHMLHTRKTILLSVKRIFNNQTVDHFLLPFTVTSSYGRIKYHTDITRLPDQPCFVVHGITKYSQPVEETQQTFISRLLGMGLESIIFLNMAIHPQYSGKKLSLLSSNPLTADTVNLQISDYIGLKEFLTLQRQADIFGCSINNPSLFYIEHIYCDKLSRLANLIDPQYMEVVYTKNKEAIPNYYGMEQYA